MDEDVESFASLFAAGFGAQQDRVEKRRKVERRSAMSDRQRKRGASRTAQMNFRCTPAFRTLTAGLAKLSDASIADVLEEAVALLAAKKGYEGD